MTDSWWNFPASSTLDVISDQKYPHQLLGALADQNTFIVFNPDGTIFLVGPEQALIVEVHSLGIRLLLIVYKLLTDCLAKNSSS